jgi:hypothetical protein
MDRVRSYFETSVSDVEGISTFIEEVASSPTMTNKSPFNVDHFLLTDPQDVDFKELEDDQLFALVAEYGSTNPLLASFALSKLVTRARRNEALKARTVPVLAAIVKDNQVDEDFFGSALTSLYQLDRLQGQVEIARIIDSCDDLNRERGERSVAHASRERGRGCPTSGFGRALTPNACSP